MSILRVPENWPLAWWGEHLVRTACPACGNFALYVERAPDTAPKITCTDCGIAGQTAVQAAFDNLKPMELPPL